MDSGLAIFEQALFDGVDPLGRVGDLKGGGVSFIVFIDKINFDQ